MKKYGAIDISERSNELKKGNKCKNNQFDCTHDNKPQGFDTRRVRAKGSFRKREEEQLQQDKLSGGRRKLVVRTESSVYHFTIRQ